LSISARAERLFKERLENQPPRRGGRKENPIIMALEQTLSELRVPVVNYSSQETLKRRDDDAIYDLG
jgi:hypothetical protein